MGFCRKRKNYYAKGISLRSDTFVIPNGENVLKWISNLVLKFHDDPTVNEFKIVIFLRQVLWYAGKREGFGRRRGENEIGRKKRRREYRQFENWPKMPLFLARVTQSLLFTLFIHFYYFIKRNSIFFHIKRINKIPFLFSLKPLF